ncbi:hypothetical protein AAFF_G00133800 [Aldrovandia affinis]|uniref:Uncharacterized protein n=1 Tax=Aldrovandia affinis TaxID=143900 RepID=A0AAD7RQA5_9TELE|nr:hypothetical protein AAFF_G00133800 [Aldrovandia affinis]
MTQDGPGAECSLVSTSIAPAVRIEPGRSFCTVTEAGVLSDQLQRGQRNDLPLAAWTGSNAGEALSESIKWPLGRQANTAGPRKQSWAP